MEEFYTLQIAGLTRRLPLCAVNEKLRIAAFVLFSDIELTVACARELLNKAPPFDIILTPEAKSIPLAYEMSRASGKKYYVARKQIKVYMPDPVAARVKSITTAREQKLYLGRRECEEMRGKRLLIADDVISTGATLTALETLLKGFGVNTVCKAAVLAEGAAAERGDIVYLEKLPIFTSEKD